MKDSQTHFLVSVGHVSVEVAATNPGEALVAAREKMCAEMPRLWDVISALDPSRFEVELIESTTARDVA